MGDELLELAFHSKELRTICENEAKANLELGPSVAEMLKHRLADLRAAKTVQDVLVGRPRVIDEREQYMAIDLCDGYLLVFAPNHVANPMTEAGDLDWSKVSRIQIMKIGGEDE